MAVQQYIGARYVTKIYENSQDPSSAEWESGVNYEPLVMVTYNYGSYLSKKPVPANIGDPAANPGYWVQTGFYNGQIAALQDQIDRIKSVPTVSDLVGSSDYEEGDIVRVNGYYTPGDGGACDYLVINTSNAFTITLSGGLYAMPLSDRPTPDIFGAKCDGNEDDTPYIDKAIQYVLFLNPVIKGVAANYQHDLGGGTVYFNKKDYYAKTKINSFVAQIKLQGEGDSSKIHVSNEFVKVNYTNVSYDDYLYAEPWNFTVNDLVFIHYDATTSVFEIDKPYGVVFNRCKFITNEDSRTKGVAIKLSTIVNTHINDCNFTGYTAGIEISKYNGTYPTGITGSSMNTTLYIERCWFWYCTDGLYMNMPDPGNGEFIRNLLCEECIFEGNDNAGINLSAPVTSNASMLICKTCHFENQPYAIKLQNCALNFDQSNMLARAIGGSNKIRYGATHDANGQDISNYMYANKTDDYEFINNQPSSKWFFDHIPSIYMSPYEYINTFEKVKEISDVTAIFLQNIVDNSVHSNVVASFFGEDIYGVFTVAITASSQTPTVAVSNNGLHIRADNAITCDHSCRCQIKWN